MTKEAFELPQEEMAGQAGRPLSDHPFEQGRAAAERGATLDTNPYVRGSAQAGQFKRGWTARVQEKAAQASGAAKAKTNEGAGDMATPAKETSGRKPRKPRPPLAAVQEELIEDSRVVGMTPNEDGEAVAVALPEEIKAIIKQVDDAIYNAAIAKNQENEFKAQMQGLMAEHRIIEASLPRGGKLLYSPGKPSLRYVAPKKEDAKEGEG